MGGHLPGTRAASPQEMVQQLVRAGKVKRKCCKSKPRCKKCPVRALEKARSEFTTPDKSGGNQTKVKSRKKSKSARQRKAHS